MIAMITASVCYLESCPVSADSSSCLLQLLQVLLPNSIAGHGLSCVMHYCFDHAHHLMHRLIFRSELFPVKVACDYCQH